ncbi:MAG: aspartate aminotransferase family protein [Flavobacteriales bacterium]|nr:aspartate aminotransferase family protein [Flavobacteriales bacterium]
MMEDFLRRGLAQTTLHPLNLKVSSACGVYIHLEDGTKMLDFISGIGVSSFGHSNPAILEALHQQVDRHLHVMVYGEVQQGSQDLAASRLLGLLPSSLDSVYFVNSGAEAIDGALKLARKVTGRHTFIAMEGGYHGNTFGALSVSSNQSRRAPFEPLLAGVEFIPFNHQDALDSIDGTQAAVIAETVQGDAGIRIPDIAWIKRREKRCNETGTLLILDEIQCGIGRTGKPFAFEHFDVTPDILCLGKALGGGMPLGAFVSSTSRMRSLAHEPDLGHITTFGGHPVACASSAAALRLLDDIDWNELELRGAQLENQLKKNSAVKAVRRLGYFIAVDMESPEAVHFCVEYARKNGLLIFYFLSTLDSFRIAPPLTISDTELAEGMAILNRAFDAWSLQSASHP